MAGSLVGYTAYVWLLDHASATKVGTYAYVNPVIAVILGYFFAGEEIGARTIFGSLLVLVGVFMITLMSGESRGSRKPASDAAA